MAQSQWVSNEFMKPLGKAIKDCVERKSWKQALYKFLRNYRATPHVTTRKPPAELLFGYIVRTLIPEINVPVDDSDVRRCDSQQKAKQKKYADKLCLRNTNNTVNVGETDFIKKYEKNKLLQHFNPEPMSIVGVKGTLKTSDKY